MLKLVDSLEAMLGVLVGVLLPLRLRVVLASEHGRKGGEGGRWSDDVAYHYSRVAIKRV